MQHELERGGRVILSTNKQRSLNKYDVTEATAGYLFILPTYLCYIIFVLLPFIAVIFLSFTKYDILSAPKFVGLDNFIEIFSDTRLLSVIINTVYFATFAVIFNVLIGLILAIMLNRRLSPALSYFFRLAYFLPVIVSYAYTSIIWQWLFSKDTGVVNYYLNLIGIPSLGWFADPKLALNTMIFMDVWKACGFAMVIFLAGLQNIPKEYYEACEIDGANAMQTTLKITVPLLTPTILLNIIIYMLGCLQIFDPMNIITQGGPGDSTRSMVMYIYEYGFQRFQMGYASAISLLFLIAISILTAIQFKTSKRWVHY